MSSRVMKFFVRLACVVTLGFAVVNVAMAKSAITAASKDSTPFVRSGFYLGPSIGYGSTDWSFLTTDKNSAAAVSSPISASDEGMVYGLIAGYQINNYFAVEGSYMHYPQSKITFAAFSAYWPLAETTTTIKSQTQQFALYLKLLVPLHIHFLGDTSIYSGVGAEETYRSDKLAKQGNKLGAIFTGGIIHFFTRHIAVEGGFDYSTGAGRSEVLPAHHYIPFLYQGHVALLYYF